MEKKYTLDSAPFCKFHAKIISYTVGGSFLDGYILGIIEFAIISVAKYMGMSDIWQGLIASSPLVGIFIGSLVFGDLADKIGRKNIYTMNFVVILITSILQFFVNSPMTLFILRLILGICIGAEYAIGPTIITEFVPSRMRGRLLTSLGIAWTAGYVAAAYVGAWMQRFGDESWRYMLASSAIIAAIVLVLRIGMPETPRWLVLKGRIDEAEAIIKKHFGDMITLEPTVKELSEAKMAPEESKGYMPLFRKGQIRHTMVAAICMSVNTLPQYAIFSFVPMILISLGIEDENTFYTLIVNGMMLAVNVAAIFVIDKLPRKKMMTIGMLISSIPLIFLGLWKGMPPMLVTVFFAANMIGDSLYGTIASYIYPSECFPTELRARGVGFCCATSRIFGIFGAFAMPIIIYRFNINIALLGIAICVLLALVLVKRWAPETKGVSIDEV